MTISALLDTCVLYPQYLRDTMLCLSEAGLFRPLWSPEILGELRRNLVGTAGLPEAAVDRTIAIMREHFDDAEISGHEGRSSAMTCDPKDRHVLAAAVHGGADLLVTHNTRDFPPASTADYPLTLTTPDDFLLDLLDLAPALVLQTLREQAARFKREPRTVAGLLTVLQLAGCPRFADEARRMIT